MVNKKSPNSDRSVNVGGDVTGSALVTGNNNTISVQFQQASLPQPETVDIQTELKALQIILTSLNDPIATGVAQKLEQEASRPEPDKSVVATALETGLTYAQNLSGFAEAIDKLPPMLKPLPGGWGSRGISCCR